MNVHPHLRQNILRTYHLSTYYQIFTIKENLANMKVFILYMKVGHCNFATSKQQKTLIK